MTLIAKFWERVPRGVSRDQCWEWNGMREPSGYGFLIHRGKKYRAHRLAVSLGKRKKLNEIEMACHKCNNPSCVNPYNLYAGDAKTNGRDRSLTGDSGSKITKDQACMAQWLYWKGNMTLNQIAERMGIRKSQAKAAIHGELMVHINWRQWVPPQTLVQEITSAKKA